MHDVPGWVEGFRGVILAVVWTVLVLRLPALRRPAQRPMWTVLLVQGGGSLAIQAPVGAWVDRMTGIPKADELAVALVATIDFATVWRFAVALHSGGGRAPAWLRRAPEVCAATMFALAVVFFAVTPVAERYGAQARGPWIGYAVVWTAYGAITAVGAAALFWRHGVTMRSPVLRLSLLALAVGASCELPYLVVRGVRWFTPNAPEVFTLAEFWFSFARFVLVALGCSLAAIEPLRKSALYRYRRQRLYGMWLLLRRATPDLVLIEPRSRIADLVAVGNSWEQLHQRVIDIRDSISYLHDGWASPELLAKAAGQAPGAGGGRSGRLVAIACWIEVTRRDSMAGAPKLHAEVDQDLLPDVDSGESTVHREIRQLLRLHRALRSRAVHDFADRTHSPTPEATAS
ncbi:DUF6545 domain-containing protein [Kitasatospora sp. NPDC052896]|uniref:DUF6545 domain-containing protein n=1 Tax=Kitasatospora sp. NPDC052896 TaxID=3364061 RepID=UPI0037CB591F